MLSVRITLTLGANLTPGWWSKLSPRGEIKDWPMDVKAIACYYIIERGAMLYILIGGPAEDEAADEDAAHVAALDGGEER
jgi:hypothetical protein